MMRHALQQAQPQRGRAGMSPAIGRTVPLNPGLTAVRTAARPLYGGRSAEAIAWRRRAPRAPFRQRLAQWRARHWRHAVLAWFVLSLIIVRGAGGPPPGLPPGPPR